MTIKDSYIIGLPKISSMTGSLTVIEENKHIPFRIKRVFYVYDFPAEARRGGHAHKHCEEFIIAISGSLKVRLDNAQLKENFLLTNPSYGLYKAQMTWCELENFSPGSICLVLASDLYDESDYIRNYEDFIKVAQ